MKRLLFFSLLLFAPSAFAARVCLEKGTGKLIEYQSAATPGTLIQNAINAGYDATQVEEKEVTPSEWAGLRSKWIEAPAKQAADQREALRQAEADDIRQKLGLTTQQFEQLRDALGH